MADVGPLSVEDLLARSAAAVKSGKTSKNMSAVEKLLAENGEGITDTVNLSPVQKILTAQKADTEKKENYFESDDYMKLKVNQLRAQLAIYSNLPGLDPNGAIMGGIEAEIRDIIGKQQEKLAEANKKSAEAEAKLKEQEEAKANALPTAEELLAKVKGTAKPEPLSKEVQALLDKAKKGASVNTSA